MLRMTRGLKMLVLAALCGALVPADADAATATLRRGLTDATFYPSGYNGVSANSIFYYWRGPGNDELDQPEVWMRSSTGTANTFRGANVSTNIRALLRFDLSAMSGQNIQVTTDATLTLTGTGNSPNAMYGLYQIAPANAGWVESTNNATNFPSDPTYPNKSNQGDPTWFYKSIDNATYAATTGFQTTSAQDTTSTKWASGQASLGNPGSNPEGYANTGGLWNPIDLVDQNPATVASNYLTMNNMDPVASAAYPNGNFNPATALSVFTIPAAIIQSWIDNPAANAGLLGRFMTATATSADYYSSDWGDNPTRRPTLAFDYQVAPQAGDFDNDGNVDGDDLTVWKQQYGTQLGGDDFLVWQRNFGASAVPVAGAVPEPASVGLLAAGALAFAVGRRRRAA